MCVCTHNVRVHTPQCTFRTQSTMLWIKSFFPPLQEFWGSNLGHQAYTTSTLPADPYHQALSVCLIKMECDKCNACFPTVHLLHLCVSLTCPSLWVFCYFLCQGWSFRHVANAFSCKLDLNLSLWIEHTSSNTAVYFTSYPWPLCCSLFPLCFFCSFPSSFCFSPECGMFNPERPTC